MKRIIVLLIIFFAALAISPFLINQKGYILVAMGDYTFESTVVTAIIMLTLLFFVLMVTLKVIRGSLRLSFGTWRKIAFASHRRATRDFNKGIASYLLGDYQQAEHLLAKSAVPSKQAYTGYLVAAAAAEKQNLADNTKHYLNQVVDDSATVKEHGLDSIVIRVKLLISQGDLTAARKLVDDYHKHIGHDARLLSLEIELCIKENRFVAVIDYLKAARKQKSIANKTIEDWESIAYSAQFNTLITEQDQTALVNYWQEIPRKLKQQDSILLAYCQTLAAQQIVEPLNDLLLPLVKKDTDHITLRAIQKLPLSHPQPLISAVQKHLKRNANSAKWLSALGHLAMAAKDWPMAEKAFASLSNLPGEQYDQADLVAFAKVLDAQQNYQAANQLYAKILK